MANTHSFHIPVMGIGYTIDTPLKVAHLGIDSVISLVDDMLLEKLRKMYCEKFEMPYQEITEKIEDFRAKRITSYLNLVNSVAERKLEELKSAALERREEIREYFNLLPDSSTIKQEFKKRTAKYINWDEVGSWLRENLSLGSIDVNIMTKIDKDNYLKKEKLPVEYNDAHAALRGFAQSDLHSSIVLSAGMNPRLYGYLEHFDDFFPDENGYIQKKIVLKVSDYRSAFIQGKFLAKKGLWVSEYRVESGLNCGGHAFATEGNLMGPILAEFRDNRKDLIQGVHEIMVQALVAKNRVVPEKELPLKITAQGGVGTAEEHEFLINHYQIDSVGWGSPFLLVPEATSVDDETMNKLAEAKEKDLYLSNISPLGVPFNNLRGNTKDVEKMLWAEGGKPGSPCPKKYVALNNEFTEKGICPASRQYQLLKMKELKKEGMSPEAYQEKVNQIIDKSCICVGLGTSALKAHHLDTIEEGEGVSVCPGPDMAYFDKVVSLKEITDHIYGRGNVMGRADRPNMFVKELNIYLDFLKDKVNEAKKLVTVKQVKYLSSFADNIDKGITYYRGLFGGSAKEKFNDGKAGILAGLDNSKNTLQRLVGEIESLK
ncbi:hypothetical protein [Prolixibacter sp. SD074]|uniref:hypothetical protein n=1 Tax=Prolixibacter sp. SD074 TaxID=2652391 RepID=UPI00129930FC|nr:hypothetical protein [Prolixibacter sp. SD074]